MLPGGGKALGARRAALKCRCPWGALPTLSEPVNIGRLMRTLPLAAPCTARKRDLRVDSRLGLKAVLEDPLQVTKILFVLVASRGTLAEDEVT